MDMGKEQEHQGPHETTTRNTSGVLPGISPTVLYNLSGVGQKALRCIRASPEGTIHVLVCGMTPPAVVQEPEHLDMVVLAADSECVCAHACVCACEASPTD